MNLVKHMSSNTTDRVCLAYTRQSAFGRRQSLPRVSYTSTMKQIMGCYHLHIERTHTFFFFFSFISLIADGPHHYHPACGHKSSHLSPVHALQFFYRDASSALLQLVNQYSTYSRSHAFRYERKNTNPTSVRIELTTSVLADVQLTYKTTRATSGSKKKNHRWEMIVRSLLSASFAPPPSAIPAPRRSHPSSPASMAPPVFFLSLFLVRHPSALFV